ncbi:MAG: PAS domain S-box protein [Spirochaetales bacterium]|nr:MAG: PAS domain S-box protein [Spirochaetales bacterium]
MSVNSENGPAESYRLKDLIDLEQFQSLQDRLNENYSFPSAIIDIEGNILTVTAWQDICFKFHRKNRETENECIQSSQYILSHLHEANPAVTYSCPHGLVDSAAPIIIDGVHYGNFFTGQFFLEEPDLDFFRRQAEKYGFDEASYLEAVRKVPVWTKEQLNHHLYFIKGLVEVISSIGLKNLHEIESKKQIKQSEEKYRYLVETLTQPVFTMNRQGVYLFMNTTSAGQLGGKPEDFIGKTMFDVFPADIAKLQFANILKAMNSGRLVESSRKTVVSGRTAWYYARIQPIMDDRGAYDKVLVILDDITGRKFAEEELYTISETLNAIFQVSPLAIMVLDLDGKIRMWNPAAERMFGWSSEEVIGGPLPYIPDNLLDEFDELSHQVFSRGGLISREVIRQRKDGTFITISLSSAVLYDVDGRPRGRMSILEDISDRKQAETRIKNALSEKETLLRELYHRTKNNMQVISSMLSLQAAKAQNKAMDLIFRETENRIQAMALVHQMLYQTQDLSSLNLSEYIRDLATMLFQSFAQSDKISLSLDLAVEENVLIDTAIPCGLILNELLSNSLKHAFPEGRQGSIRIRIARLDPQTLEMVFSDNGIGVPPLFDYRAQNSLGIQTILSLTEQQLQGEAGFESCCGITWRLRFRDRPA